MIIDMDKKPWSYLRTKMQKKGELIEKKHEYETRLACVEIMHTVAKTNASRIRLSNRFDYLMHKLKAMNRRIILLEGEETK